MPEAAEMPGAGEPVHPGPVPSAAAVPAVPVPEPGHWGPEPLGVRRTPTGDARIDALLERLADADHLPAEGHPQVYEDVHRGLREALDALDAPPGPAPAPAGPTPSPPYDLRS